MTHLGRSSRRKKGVTFLTINDYTHCFWCQSSQIEIQVNKGVLMMKLHNVWTPLLTRSRSRPTSATNVSAETRNNFQTVQQNLTAASARRQYCDLPAKKPVFFNIIDSWVLNQPTLFRIVTPTKLPWHDGTKHFVISGVKEAKKQQHMNSSRTQICSKGSRLSSFSKTSKLK